jgi:hypothetical protein
MSIFPYGVLLKKVLVFPGKWAGQAEVAAHRREPAMPIDLWTNSPASIGCNIIQPVTKELEERRGEEEIRPIGAPSPLKGG